MTKEILEKRMERLNAKVKKLQERALASQSADEVRNINEEISEVNADIEECRAELDSLNKVGVPADAKIVNGNVVGSFKEGQRSDNTLESLEYRQAFMAYVQTGEKRADAISASDTGAAIPLTVMNQVINTVRKRYGNLYNKVRKLSVKGGVDFPIGALQANFKWINDSTVSPRQKLNPLAKVQFSYHTAEIRIAQTFLSTILTLDSFEAQIAEVIAVAYMKAMDSAIVAGTGVGMPLGIVNDPRVTNVVEFKAAEINNWTAWRKKFFAKLPLGYRGGEFIFNLGTVDAYLETMADANGNPIFRQATGLEVNDGDAQNPNGRFFGRNISLVEPDILPDFDTAADGDVIGIYWQPEEYAINENFGFTMRRYFDEEANEWVDKAIVVVDGKVLNPTGYYLIKKDV